MKLPLIFAVALVGCTPTTYVVAVQPPPCKAVCVQDYADCIKGGTGSDAPDDWVYYCYRQEVTCFDTCSKDDIR